MKFLRAFRIGSYDGRIFVLLNLIIWAVLAPVLATLVLGRGKRDALLLLTGVFIFGSVLWAVTLCLGTMPWKRLKKHWPFMLACLSTIFFMIWLARIGGIWNRELHNVEPVFTPQLFGWILGSLLVVFVVAKVLCAFIPTIERKVSSVKSTKSRLWFLIAFAVVLYGVFLASNLDIDSISYHKYGRLLSVAGTVGAVIVFGIAGLLILHGRPFWISSIAAILLMTSIVVVLATQMKVMWGGRKDELVWVAVAVGLSFMVACFFLRSTCLVNETVESNDSTDVIKLPKTRPRFSIYSVAMSAFACTIVAMAYYFEPTILIFGRRPNVFDDSRTIRALQRQPGTSTFAMYDGGIEMQIEFSGKSPKDCLAPLADIQAATSLHLKNFQKNIDTKPVRSLPAFARSIDGGTVTADQFVDLVSGTPWSYLQNLKITPGESKTPLASAGRIHCRVQPGSIKAMLDRTDKTTKLASLGIGASELNSEDWKAVLSAAKHHSIQVEVKKLTPELVSQINKESPKHLTLNATSFFFGGTAKPKMSREQWSILLNSDAGILSRTELPRSVTWDATFASRGASHFVHNLEFVDGFDKNNFVELAGNYHWIFEHNAKAQPTKLILPYSSIDAIQLAGNLKNLAMLSLDCDWHPALAHSFHYQWSSTGAPIDLTALGAMPKLEELYLGNYKLNTFSFMKGMPALKILQTHPTTDSQDFLAKNAPNLEQLTLRSEPEARFEQQLPKLTKLKELTVVSSAIYGDSVEENKYLKKLQQLVGPNVNVRLIPFDKHKPTVPKEFQEHIQKVRGQMRAKYLSSPPASDQ